MRCTEERRKKRRRCDKKGMVLKVSMLVRFCGGSIANVCMQGMVYALSWVYANTDSEQM